MIGKSLSPDFRYRLQQAGVRSVLLAPIKYHDEILGILILSHKDVGNYNEQDVKRIQPLLPHFALAIKQAEEYQAL